MGDRVERCPQGYTDCPFPAEDHHNWCGHQGAAVTHLHWPKKGMGGNNPKSKIVALACWPCHDKIDNFGGNIITEDLPGKGLTTWATDVRGNELFEKRLGEAGNAAAEGVSTGGTPSRRSEPQATRYGSSKANSRIGPSAAASSASPLSPAAEEQLNRGQSGLLIPPSAAEPSFFPVSSETGDYCRRGMWLMFLALRLQKMTTEASFEIGDWVNEGENTLGEAAHQFFGVFSYWQIATWASVARRVPALVRHKELPFGHHQTVAALPESEQGEMLAAAVQGRWRRERLREAVGGTTEPGRPEPMGVCPRCGAEGKLSEFRRVT